MSDEYIKAFNHLMEASEKLGLIEKIRNIFSKRRTVLVLGASGVGKTSFIKSLNDKMPEVIHYLSRTETAKKYKINFINSKLEFIDTPGQEYHESRRISVIRESMKEEVLGVINLVCFGYHEQSTGLETAFNNGIISAEYLKKFREIEIKSLNEWKNILGSPETTKWLITVINKADLWWDNRLAVLEYYSSGIYNDSLGELKSLKPIVMEYSCIIHKFYSMGKVSGSFDNEIRTVLQKNLISSIITLMRD